MFSENDRNSIFEHFWKRMSWSEKRTFIHTLVDVVPTKDNKNQVHEVSHKANTLAYHLKKDDMRLRVCRTMLLYTLSIGSWSLQNWSKSVRIPEQTLNIPERKSERFKKDRVELKTFSESLPKTESHYCRASSKKLY